MARPYSFIINEFNYSFLIHRDPTFPDERALGYSGEKLPLRTTRTVEQAEIAIKKVVEITC